MAPSWDYVPVGPYTVHAVSLVGDKRCPPMIGCRATIVEAAELFEQVRSPLPERSVILTDFNDVAVLSHNTGSRYDLRWIGIAAGFDAMREAGVLDPYDIDFAEIKHTRMEPRR